MDNIKVKLKEVREVFECVEELNEFLHRPKVFDSPEEIDRFLESGAYKKLHHIYYDVLWEWLPPEIQREYENR